MEMTSRRAKKRLLFGNAPIIGIFPRENYEKYVCYYDECDEICGILRNSSKN